jgi:hypothetical protein
MHNPPEMTEEVVPSWNRCHGAFYQLNENDLLWNQREQRLLRYWKGVVNEVPVLWAEAAPEGTELGISPGGIWLSLHGEVKEGMEAAFASSAEKYAREQGKKRLAVASDEFHFLPGIPVDEAAGERLADAFKKNGFSTADCADFVGAPENPQSEAYLRQATADSLDRGWTLRLVESDRDKEELSAFLEKEFKGRWLREWKVWGRRNDTGRVFWNLLRDENQRVLGFSRLGVRGRLKPFSFGWTPGAMRLPLSVSLERLDTDSCLGPIGIAATERGRGAGKVLLGLSLRELSLHGAKLVCIDWTNAYNYYTPLGFHVVRRYLSVWKEL